MTLNQPGIYAITNLDDGRATTYIGSTVSFKRRWCQHKSLLQHNTHPNPYLQAAWNKYGEHSFWFSILEVVGEHDVIIEREQHWLDEYRATGKVYNLGTIARHPLIGYSPSEETRRKMSKSRRKRPPPSEETRQRMSKALKGKKHGPPSEETRRRMSEAKKGKRNDANAAPYPAFHNRVTGEIIPAGHNLLQLCQEYRLQRPSMWRVIHGQRNHHQGWELL